MDNRLTTGQLVTAIIAVIAALGLLVYFLGKPVLGIVLAVMAMVMFSYLLLIAGVGVLGWQVFRFLKDGFWTPLSMLDVLRLGPENAYKVDQALSDWRGLARLLDTAPASMTLLVVGGVMVLIFGAIKAYFSGAFARFKASLNED